MTLLADVSLDVAESTLFGSAPDNGIDVPGLVASMLASGPGISDIIFSPGRPPQVEQHGQLTAVDAQGLTLLSPGHTAQIARHFVTGNSQAVKALQDQVAALMKAVTPAATDAAGPPPAQEERPRRRKAAAAAR